MSSLSLAGLIEKNKVSTDSSYLMLLEIQIDPPIYLVRNNENITWNGIEWVAFPFQIGDLTENDKESPTINLKVSNVTRTVGALVADAKGGGGTQAIIRVVNSKLLNEDAFWEGIFQVTKTDIDTQWVSFTLGVPNDLTKRFPPKTVMKDFCSYLSIPGLRHCGNGVFVPDSGYCGIECGLPESIKNTPNHPEFASCDGTLSSCRARGNSARFGGEPGLNGNIYS